MTSQLDMDTIHAEALHAAGAVAWLVLSVPACLIVGLAVIVCRLIAS